MPYIKPERRAEFDEMALQGRHPITAVAGELNYELTLKCIKYMDIHGTNYQVLNDIVGALECAKLEIYRRIAAPYEDKKIAENGDVYPPPT